MITAQVQGWVPSQAPPTDVSQASPKQHGPVGEHAWPAAEQVAPGSHVPTLAPPGMRQPRPAQQSDADVQALLCGWQACGAWHVPPVQMPEQHPAPLEHVCPLAVQIGPPSTPPVPASVPPVPPSVPPPGEVPVGRQTYVSSSTARHAVPAQQPELDGSHTVPTGSHVGAGWQEKAPSAPGRQRLPLQHWSLNWQVLPWEMQQPSSPV
jgi:hypothetical protein